MELRLIKISGQASRYCSQFQGTRRLLEITTEISYTVHVDMVPYNFMNNMT